MKIVFKRRVEYHIANTFSQVTSNNTMCIVLPIFIWFLLTLQYIMNPLINFTDFTHGLDWIYTFLLWSRKNFRSSDSCLDFYSGYCNNGFINSRSKYYRNISILILLLLSLLSCLSRPRSQWPAQVAEGKNLAMRHISNKWQ